MRMLDCIYDFRGVLAVNFTIFEQGFNQWVLLRRRLYTLQKCRYEWY